MMKFKVTNTRVPSDALKEAASPGTDPAVVRDALSDHSESLSIVRAWLKVLDENVGQRAHALMASWLPCDRLLTVEDIATADRVCDSILTTAGKLREYLAGVPLVADHLADPLDGILNSVQRWRDGLHAPHRPTNSTAAAHMALKGLFAGHQALAYAITLVDSALAGNMPAKPKQKRGRRKTVGELIRRMDELTGGAEPTEETFKALQADPTLRAAGVRIENIESVDTLKRYHRDRDKHLEHAP